MSSFDFWWFSVPYVPLLLRNAFYLAPTIIEQSTNEVVIKSNVDRKKAPKTAKLGYFHLKVQNKTFLSSESVSEVMFFFKYNLIQAAHQTFSRFYVFYVFQVLKICPFYVFFYDLPEKYVHFMSKLPGNFRKRTLVWGDQWNKEQGFLSKNTRKPHRLPRVVRTSC